MFHLIRSADMLLVLTVFLNAGTAKPQTIVWLTRGSGESRAEAAVAAVLQEDLQAMGVRLVLKKNDDRIPRRETADRLLTEHHLAVFWYNPDTQSLHCVYGATATEEMFRKLQNAAHPDSFAESVGVIVRELVSALLVVEDDLDARPASPHAESTPKKTDTALGAQPSKGGDDASLRSSESAKWRFRPSAGYVLSLFSADAVVEHGAAIALGVRSPGRFGFFASYTFFWPLSVKKTLDDSTPPLSLDMRLVRHSLAVGATVEKHFTRLFGVNGSFGVSFHYLEFGVRSEFEEVSPLPDRQDWQVSLPLAVRPLLLLNEHLYIYLSVCVDIVVRRPVFRVDYEGRKVVFFEPFRLQPLFSLGLATNF